MSKWTKIETSALVTFFGFVLLFSSAILVVLIAPRHIDPTWTEPTGPYQVQMYEVADPNVYISSPNVNFYDLQFVYHLKNGFTLLSFEESEFIKIIAPENLEKYITKYQDPVLKLTARLMMLKKPENEMAKKADSLSQKMQSEWETANPDWKEKKLSLPAYQIYELYQVEGDSAFSIGPQETILSEWVDKNYVILDLEKGKTTPSYHLDPGVIFVKNPMEYRVSPYNFSGVPGFRYDPNGEKVKNLETLQSKELGFRSREELIAYGEHLYNIEGCWYCHTDQTRTLIQDTVLNGSDSYPAPPSSANEYIYQEITFPGTRRIGPDLSRVGIKRPSRDWHKGHFWSPKTASRGSVMPSFQHFFDSDPRGTIVGESRIPNHKFEAIYQYLMTKGTRITSPNKGWWIGKDPIDTKEIIEGLRK